MDSLDCDSFNRSLYYLLFTYYATNDTWSHFVGIGNIYATQSNRMDCIFVLDNLCLFERLRWSSQLVSIVTAMATILTTIVRHLSDSHADHDDGSCISPQTCILFCSIHCKLTVFAYQLFSHSKPHNSFVYFSFSSFWEMLSQPQCWAYLRHWHSNIQWFTLRKSYSVGRKSNHKLL